MLRTTKDGGGREELVQLHEVAGDDGATSTIEARGLRKAYGGVVAVEELSFTARAGEVIGLLGPNGAGKTTAIRVLTTILAPTAGSFAVAGVPHTRPAEIRQRVGVLPESAGYPEQQTGAEFLRYHARLFGHSRASAPRHGRGAARAGRPGRARALADRAPTAAACGSGSASRGRW